MTEAQLLAARSALRNMGQSVVYTRDGEWIESRDKWAGIVSYTGRNCHCTGPSRGEALAELGTMSWHDPQTVAQYCGVTV
jgi:hypothetical protein